MAKTLETGKDAVIGGIIDAAKIIVGKFLDQQVFDAIRSEKYRSILKKMIRHGPVDRFRRSEMTKNLTKEEIKVFDNFLQRMKKLGALMQGPTVRGGYQSPNRLYSLYFSFYSQKLSSQNHHD